MTFLFIRTNHSIAHLLSWKYSFILLYAVVSVVGSQLMGRFLFSFVLIGNFLTRRNLIPIFSWYIKVGFLTWQKDWPKHLLISYAGPLHVGFEMKLKDVWDAWVVFYAPWSICFTFLPFVPRYVRVLGNLVHAIQIKTKLCQLVEVMMERRDDLSFCQEMKFRWVKYLGKSKHVQV